MNRKRFYELIENPHLITPTDINNLEVLISNYPYFQTAIVLHAIGLRKNDSAHYKTVLRKAAVYARSRKKLKYLVEKVADIDNQTTDHPEDHSSSFSVSKHNVTTINRKKDIVKDYSLLLPYEIEELIKEGKIPANYQANNSSNSILTKDKSDKNQLIENFIKSHSFVNQLEKDFCNVDKIADESSKDSRDIVSETLAKIHLNQGNYLKAIEIYETLMLKLPEKNAYFASQIREIKERFKK
ncbi:MAG: hypothetical protein ACEPOV_13405 [Hyphomicrobiales bacterium]